MPIRDTLLLACITSLTILFVYESMKEGDFLFWLRQLLDRMIRQLPVNVYLWISKPLFGCLFCMASFWGILFTIPYFSFTWWYLQLLFIIAGINYLLGVLISKNEDE